MYREKITLSFLCHLQSRINRLPYVSGSQRFRGKFWSPTHLILSNHTYCTCSGEYQPQVHLPRVLYRLCQVNLLVTLTNFNNDLQHLKTMSSYPYHAESLHPFYHRVTASLLPLSHCIPFTTESLHPLPYYRQEMDILYIAKFMFFINVKLKLHVDNSVVKSSPKDVLFLKRGFKNLPLSNPLNSSFTTSKYILSANFCEMKTFENFTIPPPC